VNIGPVVSEEKILIEIALPVDIENKHALGFQRAGIPSALGMPVFDGIPIPSTQPFKPKTRYARFRLEWLRVGNIV